LPPIAPEAGEWELTIPLRLTQNQKRRIEARAAEHGVTASAWMVAVINGAL
jgi:hypothetical protein